MGVSALLKATVWGDELPKTVCLCHALIGISSQNRFLALTRFSSYLSDRQIGEIKLYLKIAIHITFVNISPNCTVTQRQPARGIRRFVEINIR